MPSRRPRDCAANMRKQLTQGLRADRKRLLDLLQKMVDEQAIGRGVHPGPQRPEAGCKDP